MNTKNLTYKDKQQILTHLGKITNYEFLGSGSYGDVVTPAFPCSWDFPRYHKKTKYIGKFFSDVDAALQEVSLFAKVKQIDPLSLFLVLPVHQCKIILERTTQHFKNLVIAAKRTPKDKYDYQIIYPYAGKEFYESNTNITKIQTFIFPILFLAFMIGFMNVVHEFNHNDIKTDNVLYYNKHLKLIDFGLANEKGIYSLFYMMYINQVGKIATREVGGLMADPNVPYEQNAQFYFHMNYSPEFIYLNNMLRIYIYELNQFFQIHSTIDFETFNKSINPTEFIKRFDNYFQSNFLQYYTFSYGQVNYNGLKFFNAFSYFDNRVILDKLSVSRIPYEYKTKCLKLMPSFVNDDLLLPSLIDKNLSYAVKTQAGESIISKFQSMAKEIYDNIFYPEIFKQFSTKQDAWAYGLLLIEYAIINKNKYENDPSFKILISEITTGLLNVNVVERYDTSKFHKEVLEKYIKSTSGKNLVKQYVIYIKDYFFPRKNDKSIREDKLYQSEVNYVSEFLSQYNKYVDHLS
jgi:hypothetical protein